MKCPSCNKMASYNDPEVESNSDDLSGTDIVLEGRMALTSACCGDELKSWDYHLESTIEHDIPEGKEAEHELSFDCEEPVASDYYDGKPGTPARYRKHMYVVEQSVTVTCSCGWTTTLDLKDENQASGFDELV